LGERQRTRLRSHRNHGEGGSSGLNCRYKTACRCVSKLRDMVLQAEFRRRLITTCFLVVPPPMALPKPTAVWSRELFPGRGEEEDQEEEEEVEVVEEGVVINVGNLASR